VHFLHVRSPAPAARPLILTHGWPGSVAEFLDIIGPLNDPGAHGGDPADAFHLVIPSVPGYGFSGPVTETGWDLTRVARAWAELMRRLGYRRTSRKAATSARWSPSRSPRWTMSTLPVHMSISCPPPPGEIPPNLTSSPSPTWPVCSGRPGSSKINPAI
jgi:hypothetical protein